MYILTPRCKGGGVNHSHKKEGYKLQFPLHPYYTKDKVGCPRSGSGQWVHRLPYIPSRWAHHISTIGGSPSSINIDRVSLQLRLHNLIFFHPSPLVASLVAFLAAPRLPSLMSLVLLHFIQRENKTQAGCKQQTWGGGLSCWRYRDDWIANIFRARWYKIIKRCSDHFKIQQELLTQPYQFLTPSTIISIRSSRYSSNSTTNHSILSRRTSRYRLRHISKGASGIKAN